MKKVNLLSKAEMKKVMGGVADVAPVACGTECTTDGAACGTNGRCTFFAKTKECPDGEYYCIV